MLVRKPSEEILKFKGHSLVLVSSNPVEDSGRFDAEVIELRMLLTSALQDYLKV